MTSDNDSPATGRVVRTSRTGKAYFLHRGPKRGGGQRYFLSTKSGGALDDAIPEGFEIHETVNGQVRLRRKRPQLIRGEEISLVERSVPDRRGRHRYKVEARGKQILIHESEQCLALFDGLAGFMSAEDQEDLAARLAHYLPVMRFVLVDREERRFQPERYCFRGSVDDWISIGSPGLLADLVRRFLKHLGSDEFFELRG